MVLEIDRLRGGREIAIQIAVADAFAACVGERIGDRHEGDAATDDSKPPRIDIGEHPLNRLGAAGFIAMHRAKHDEAWAGFKAGVVVRFEMRAVSGSRRQGGGSGRGRGSGRGK